MRGSTKLVIARIAAVLLVAGGGCGSVKADHADAPIPQADGPQVDASIPQADASVPQVCTPGAGLRCEGDNLISCNLAGTAEVSQTCALGCNSLENRCTDIAPSNGMGAYLEMTAGERGVGFTDAATIDTNACSAAVSGQSLSIKSAFLTESSGLKICVLIVGSLTALDVTTTGTNALAIVSNGDIKIQGTFSVSANGGTAGPGAHADPACVGGNANKVGNSLGGAGGGGFGSPGGGGGSATNSGNGQNAAAAAGGGTIGDPTLVPLRGGCDSGTYAINGTYIGRGGGALQLVSRARIIITGTVAANGSSISGGGSGGGILLEAPTIAVAGSIVANGAGGAAGSQVPTPGEAGHLDAQPAAGGQALSPPVQGNGGNGAAGAATTTAAAAGESVSTSNNSLLLSAGHGGGGVGRIRINVAPAGFISGGVVSPPPTTGTLATQ